MKILFVDDDAMNRRVVKDMLGVVGAAMDEAESGAAGLRAIEAERYDIVLMDLRMPGMDGLTAIGHIRRWDDTRGRVPIVVVTADTSSDLEKRCLAAGANALLMKPVAMTSLLDTVGRMLARPGEAQLVLE